jgi:nucleotide-binding universal stress UspA family protein
MNDETGCTGWLRELVVGLDGSEEATAALCWAASALAPNGRLHAIHVVTPGEELAVDAALADSVAWRHRRERELEDAWISPVTGGHVDIFPEVVEGGVAESLLDIARRHDADAVVVGHHPRARFGPRVVGHVTADVLHHADRPVVVVPGEHRPSAEDDAPIVVGVGIAEATRAAVAWATRQGQATGAELRLVHALGPRSLFRADGVLEVLAYHLDPTVVSDWVEEDLLAAAERVSESVGDQVDLSMHVETGRTGRLLVEAGAGARLLVIGRGNAPFVRHAMAPYLRHALIHAPCPVVVVPVEER